MVWVIGSSIVISLVTMLVMLLLLRRARVIRRREGSSVSPASAAASPASSVLRSYPLRAPVMNARVALIISLVLVLDIVVAAGVTAYFQRENIRQAELLQAEGIVTRAEVIALDIVEDDEGDETYYVTYTFVSRPDRPEEREITRRESVPYELYSRLEQGGRIEVIYAPSEPGVARVTAGYEPGAVDYLPGILGAAVILPSLVALGWFFSRYRRAARLEEEGVTATAEVLGMYEDSSGDGASYYVACQLPGGGPVRCSISSALYRQLRVGSYVTVRYLSEDPRVFRVEGG